MTKLLLAAVTLFLSVGTIVEGLRDQKTKKTPRLRGLQDTSTCSFDFSQASSGDSKYDMKVEKNDPSSYLKVTITEGTFKGVYDSWCIDHGRGIGLNNYKTYVMSAFDERLQPGGKYADAVDKPQYLRNLAWLINNVNVGDMWEGDMGAGEECKHEITMGDLQNAAWNIIDNSNGYENTSSGYGYPANICVAEQVAKYAIENGGDYELDCTDPNEQIPIVFVSFNNDNKQQQVLMGEFFLTDIDGLATVTTPAPTTAPETTDKTAETYECPAGSTVVEVDFNEFSSGQYVDQLTSSLKVTAAGHKEKGYTPGGKARIFDSNNPTGGDKDLGSPNYSCDGPGVGKGGRKGRPGENCNDLGKLLIIQESNKVDPDDLASGGKFTFSTDADKEMTFLRMGVLDIDETDVTLAVDSPVKFAGVGDNGFQDLVNPNPKLFANSFEVSMPGSGAVAYLVLCERPAGYVDPSDESFGGPPGHCSTALGYDFGLKMDDGCQDTNGMVSFADAGFELNGDDSADLSLLGKVQVECLADNEARITTTYGGAVRIKGGNGYEVYNIGPGVATDGLSPPSNASGNPAGISHIEFCFNNKNPESRALTDLCPDDDKKTEPGICGCGTPDVDTDDDGVMDCKDKCPTDADKTEPGVCGCGKADVDTDGDGVMDCKDLCPNDEDKIVPGVCGCGMSEKDTDNDGTPDCNDKCPADPDKTEPGKCGCGVEDTDSDGDGIMDCNDLCPDSAIKTKPGVCGCDMADADSDGDGAPDCKDDCPDDPEKVVPGTCGCGVSDKDTDHDGTPDCNDECPIDADKTEPGACGCGKSDVDTDGDGTADCLDSCPKDAKKTEPGTCGCGVSDVDSDGDGTPDCNDKCPNDADKTEPGTCGCGVAETDSDGDGTPDCVDKCPNDPEKVMPGACGCGESDVDTDVDGVSDCEDSCPLDPEKTAPGLCGCGVADWDSDFDGIMDCDDKCPDDDSKTVPGICGCGVPDEDSDGDGVMDCVDECPDDASKSKPGDCGCGTPDDDTDKDGVMDCDDACPEDADKIEPGVCGCGVSDVDSDGDGTPDCKDECPADSKKTEPGTCGCGVSDKDSDGDGTPDCNDTCKDDKEKTEPGVCGCGTPDVDTDGDGVMDCEDQCPKDADKTEPGKCGCGVPDADSDGDGTPDCLDECPNDPKKTKAGTCGCGTPDTDSDSNGVPDCVDPCPFDATKEEPGVCGCGTPDDDSDGDGVPDCNDDCPFDAEKTEPGKCGCGAPDVDADGDGIMDCNDECPTDTLKDSPGVCGCNVPDVDTDGDGVMDCNDLCAEDPSKASPGICGCGVSDKDTDDDGTPDCNDKCPNDPNKTEPGSCGCGVEDNDTDGDGTPDCKDSCPDFPGMTEPGVCGCGVEDVDTDGDGVMDCQDICFEDPAKTDPGECGCGVPDTDSDGDGTPDCNDECPTDPSKTKPGACGCGTPDTDTDGNGVTDCQDTTDRTVEDPTDKPTKGSGSGDPHFKTWTGDKFDYHGECDLVLVDNPSFNDGQGLKIHIRTTRVKYFSYIEKIAVQIGEDVLEFDNDVENFLMNGQPVEQNRKHHKTHFGGFVVRRDMKALSIRLHDEGRISHIEHSVAKIDLVTRKNGFPAVIVDGGNTDIFRGSLGLIGDWETGKRIARDGVTELNDSDATAFALEWQVRDFEPMLFQDARFPQYPTTCTPPAQRLDNRLGLTHIQKEAEKACSHWKEDIEDCIFDVIATRDVLVAVEGHIETVA